MARRDTIRITGTRDVLRRLKSLGEVGQARLRAEMATAMGLELMKDAVPEAPAISGTLRRSGTVETLKAGARAGFGIVYARRVHEGFAGKDSRGRRYNQPGNPYMVRGLRKARRDMLTAAGDIARREFKKRTVRSTN